MSESLRIGGGTLALAGDETGELSPLQRPIAGIAHRWGIEVFRGVPGAGLVHVIQPQAAAVALSDGTPTRMLYNHSGIPLAATTNGTLSVSLDGGGLPYRALPPETHSPATTDAWQAVADGRITESSFHFKFGTVERARYAGQNEAWHGMPFVTHTQLAAIYDVSLVDRGGQEGTSVGMELAALGFDEAELALAIEESIADEAAETGKSIIEVQKRRLRADLL